MAHDTDLMEVLEGRDQRVDSGPEPDDIAAEAPDEQTLTDAPEADEQDLDLDCGDPEDDLGPVRSAVAGSRDLAGIDVGDVVEVTARALRARVEPAGKQAVTKDGRPILRPRGYSFRVHDQQDAGGRWWVSGGKYWYARSFVQKKSGDGSKHAKRMGRAAARYAVSLVGSGCRVGYCQALANSINGVPPSGGSAQESWNLARKRVRTTDGDDIPLGVQVHFKGSGRFGHVAVSIGGGKVVSSDWPHAGAIGTAKIDDIAKQWRMKLLGYKVVDVNGYRLG